VHYRSGINRGGGFRCEIIGTEGELHLIGGPFSLIEMVDLNLRGAHSKDEALLDMPVPQQFLPQPSQGIMPDNVMGLYDRLYTDLETGSRTAPSFSDAFRNHGLVEAIDRSSKVGRRIPVNESE
jgi:predicted dehydrogenase